MEDNPEKCPKCGAELEDYQNYRTPTASGRWINFVCGTAFITNDKNNTSKQKGPIGEICYKRQITTLTGQVESLKDAWLEVATLQQENRELKEVLGRAKEIVEDYPKRCIHVGPEAKVNGGWGEEFAGCQWCGESADSTTKIIHTKDCLATIAAALLPDLEKWVGKE